MSTEQTPTESGTRSEEERRNAFVAVDAASMRFFATCGVAGLFLLGFAYSNEYFKSFGLSIRELDLSYVETTARGIYLLQDEVVLVATLGLVASSVLIVWAVRNRFGDLGFYVSAVLLFFLICYVAVRLGAYKAEGHAALITNGEAGQVAYCQLSADANFAQEFKKTFETMTLASRMRKIVETKDMVYLSYALESVPEDFHGQSIGINKSDIVYCRIIGQ